LYSEYIEQGDVIFADNEIDLLNAIEQLTINSSNSIENEFEKFQNAIESEIINTVILN
jgi:hypothetical protein